MTKMMLAAAIAAVAFPALAQEDKITLKDGPGKEAVEVNCSVCQSLDYIPMNSRFIDRPKWDATIKKMTGPLGATIDDKDAAQILDYLVKNYGG